MRHSRHRRPLRGRRAHGSVRTQAWTGQRGWSASPAGRAVRLIFTLGGAAAGLCLVLGMVALVATIGNRGAVHSGTAGAGSRPGHSERAYLTVGATIASYSGAGLTHQFRKTIKVPDTWGISWAFRCQPGRTPGCTVADRTRSTVPVKDPASRGHGIRWDFHAPGNHQLLIISDCTWHVTIVLPGKAGQPGPNPGGQHPVEHGHPGGHGSKHRHHPSHSPGAGHGQNARHGPGKQHRRGRGRNHATGLPVGPAHPEA
jgi:hypothetical protein